MKLYASLLSSIKNRNSSYLKMVSGHFAPWSFRPQSFRPNQKSLRSIIEVTSHHTRVTSLHTEVTSLHDII